LGSFIVVFDSEFVSDSPGGALELHPPGVGGASQLEGDFAPLPRGDAQVGDREFPFTPDRCSAVAEEPVGVIDQTSGDSMGSFKTAVDFSHGRPRERA